MGELAQVLGQSQPRVSRHVRILCDAGLAERRKEGSWVFLRSAIGEERRAAAGRRRGAAAGHGRARRCRSSPRAAPRTAAILPRSAPRARQRRRPISPATPGNGTRLRVLHCARRPGRGGAGQRALAIGTLGALLDVGTGTGRMAELFAAARRATSPGSTRAPKCCASPATRLQQPARRDGRSGPGRFHRPAVCRCQLRYGAVPSGAALCAGPRRRAGRGRARGPAWRAHRRGRFRRA